MEQRNPRLKNHRSAIDEIKESITSIEKNSIIINENMKYVVKKIDGLEKAVYGNGRKGLLDRMTAIEIKLKDFFENSRYSKVNVWHIITSLIAISAIAVGVVF